MKKSGTKYAIIIPDGAADRPVKSLKGKTPLEAAETPFLDRLAARSRVGLADNIPPGFTPGTDIGCMSIFGYDPTRFYSGRGPLEAAQLGVPLQGSDLAFRCNLITQEKGVLKDYSADHVSTAEARTLLEELNRVFEDEPVKFFAGTGTGYRNLMVMRVPRKSTPTAKLAPPHDILGERIDRHLPPESEEPLLRKLMLDSREVLEKHPVNTARIRRGKGPANMIWLWGQGRPPKWPTYAERFEKRGAVITAVDLVKGIGIYAGLDVINVPGATGFFDTNYEGKARYALDSLGIRDVAVIHIEATDEAGHMGKTRLKIKAIEDIDRKIIGPVMRGLEKMGDHKILVVPDHQTCVTTRTHAPDPVPYLIYSSRRPVKGPAKFCERSAAKSSDQPVEGHRLVEMLFSES